MSSHSLFSASGGPKWFGCPGSLVLEQSAPQDTGSVYAREGTAAHFLASESLEAGKHPREYLGRVVFVGDDATWTYDAARTAFPIDQDMVDNVAKYTESITALADRLGGTLLVEQRLNYSEYLQVDADQAWGTGDAVILTDDEIIVGDLKYGRGEAVEVEDNIQLQLYALGALQTFGSYGDFKTVRLQIHQPRTAGLSEVVYTVEELLVFANRARSAAASVGLAFATSQGADWNDTFLRAGEKQCRWCKAKATCPALRDAVSDVVLDVIPATPDEFADAAPAAVTESSDAAWLAAVMAKADMIESWIKSVRAETERRLLAGVPVPGHKLVRGKKGNRAWANELQVEELLCKSFRLKKEEAFNYSLISPAQCEKLLKDQPKRWSKVEALITQSEGKISVAPEKDPRPALDIKPVEDDFSIVSEFA